MDASACPCNSAASQPRMVSAVPAVAESPSLLDRLTTLFHRNRAHAAPGSPYSAPQQSPIQTVSFQQTSQPSASSEPPQAQEVILTSAQQTMPQLNKEFDKKVG